MRTSEGARTALLLLGGFNALVDEVVRELARRGHPGVTATHEFALRAIEEGGGGASDLGRRLGVSKQAAAKTIAALERMGYVEGSPDPDDRRRRRLTVTDRGYEMTEIGAAAFDRLRARWATAIGPNGLATVESALLTLNGHEPDPAEQAAAVGNLSG